MERETQSTESNSSSTVFLDGLLDGYELLMKRAEK